MRIVFADSLYWVAITHQRDPWRKAALRAKAECEPCRLITTDDVLDEFLAAFSNQGDHFRKVAVQVVQDILSNSNITVVPQSRESFLLGLSLYADRPDKGYSLTDCISMNVMKREGISEILTHDRHFAQEGFTALIAKEGY